MSFKMSLGLSVAALLMTAPAAFAEGCDASATNTWKATADLTYTIEGRTYGPTCDTAVAVLTVRTPDGALAYYEAFDPTSLMMLAGRPTSEEMAGGLAEWVNVTNEAFASTDKLPKGIEGADAPESGEFPFYPDEYLDRASYEEIRGGKHPMFCFVQGMESTSCLYSDGGLFIVGLQTFPG